MTHNSDGNVMDTPLYQILPCFTHVESHASGVSLLESGKQRYIKAINNVYSDGCFMEVVHTLTHYSDGCIVTVAPVFQRSCTNNMTHYMMMDVYSNGYNNSHGYTRITEELYKPDALQMDVYSDGCTPLSEELYKYHDKLQ